MECLEMAAKYMEKAQRYEVMGDIYRIVIPIYEKLRNFQVMWVPLSQHACVCVCLCGVCVCVCRVGECLCVAVCVTSWCGLSHLWSVIDCVCGCVCITVCTCVEYHSVSAFHQK